MLEIISLLSLGFLLGLEHALDADHLAAIATIATKSGSLKKAFATGIYWGLGHTAMLMIVGIILLSSNTLIPQNISNILEGIVGAMLIFLGIKNIFGYTKNMLHAHEGEIHVHPQKNEHTHKHFSFWIGMVHGLAGSAALTLIIVSTIHSTMLGITYITLFGIGSIAGMGCMSFLMQLPGKILSQKMPAAQKIIPLATGSLSTIIGIQIINPALNKLSF